MSLENLVNALGDLFKVGTKITTIDDRDALYKRIIAIHDIVAGTTQLASLTTYNASNIASLVTAAQTDIAYRYALYELNPFAIFGANYTPHNTTGKLDLYNETTGTGSLSTLYLQDRAAMLSWLNKTYTDDTDIGRVLDGSAWYFKDEASSKQVWVGNPISVKSDPLLRKVLFGQTGADILTGSGNADHIYGGLGYDTLSGGDGGDYIEGNDGNDTLNGGADRDTLLGGTGNDTLTGGLGNDRLEGGLGNDTYLYTNNSTTNDGFDILTDIDGQGIVRYNGIDLNGGAQTGLNTYLSADGKYSYLVQGNLTTGATLYINSALRIDGFKNGQLGITLGAAIATSPSSVILGTAGNDSGPLLLNSTALGQEVRGLAGSDEIYLNHDNTTALGGTEDDTIAAYGIGHTLRGEDGNDFLQVAYSKNGILTDQNDFVSGVFVGSALMSDFNAGADRLYGGLGNDRAIAGPGDDLIEGNDGNDYLDGGLGADVLLGGEGADVLIGGATQIVQARPDASWVVYSDNYLGWSGSKSGSNATWINLYAAVGQIAEDGDDVLDGGGGDDRIEGDAGNDILLGGTGNDILMGDADSTVLRIALHGNDYLDGGDGDDELYGQGGNDELFGGSGKDKLYGDSAGDVGGDDYLDGEGEDDILVGAGGADTLFGGDGDDQLSGDSAGTANLGSGDDYLDGEDGIDLLIGGGGADTLFGGIGNDQLHGDGSDVTTNYQGADYLDGESGNDTLLGYGGNDTLIGGTGNDILIGGAGNDTYIFKRGDGVDYVYDDLTPGANTYKFGPGVNPADIKLRQGSLLLDLGNGDQIHIEGFIQDDVFNSVSISSFEFDDGTVLTSSELLARGFDLDGTSGNDVIVGTNTTDRISGMEGNDRLYGGVGTDTLLGGAGFDQLFGGAGDDTLEGGVGDDFLFGEMGNDTYRFSRGDGRDTIQGFGLNDAGLDRIAFGPGISANNVFMARSGNDLYMAVDAVDNNEFSVYAASDYVLLQSVFSASGSFLFGGVDFADGSSWTAQDIKQKLITATEAADVLTGYELNDAINGLGGDDLIQGRAGDDYIRGGAGADRLSGEAGNDILEGGAGDDLYVGGGAGDDDISGGTGNDWLWGGPGNDIYRFGRGDGFDYLNETDGLATDSDSLILGADVMSSAVSLYRQGDDLALAIDASPTQLWVQNFFTSANNRVERIVFGDGSEWDIATILSRVVEGSANAMTGTAGNDVFIVDHVNDTITEAANQGTDTVQSGVTYTLGSNVENLTLTGPFNINGTGNALNNILIGNSGNNIIKGGGWYRYRLRWLG